MADTAEVNTPSEFLRLLEESRVLGDHQLRVVRQMLPDTSTSKMLARRLVAKGLLTRWQAGQLLVGWTKLRLGNHRLCKQIGKGEYGRVFLAEHVQLQREVAIKTLSRRFTQRKEIVDQFLEDARQVAALDHRNLVHVLDVDSANDQYFVVMEYVVGRDLGRLVAESGPLPFLVVADYLLQAADGLQHAHSRGVIHRDLRPQNLMLDQKGGIKIVGLGMGRLAVMSHALALHGAADDGVVAADYRSPEQLRGETEGDVSSDIFSLGATARYLLTGRPPARGPRAVQGGDGATSVAVSLGEADLIAVRPDIPASLAAIVAKMTAEPSDRFASAEEVRRAWHEWLALQTEVAGPSEPQPPQPQSPQTVAGGSLRPLAMPPPLRVEPTMIPAGVTRRQSEDCESPLAGDAGAAATASVNSLPSRYWLAAAGLAFVGLILGSAYIWWPGPSTEVAFTSENPGAARSPSVTPKLRANRAPVAESKERGRGEVAEPPSGESSKDKPAIAADASQQSTGVATPVDSSGPSASLEVGAGAQEAANVPPDSPGPSEPLAPAAPAEANTATPDPPPEPAKPPEEAVAAAPADGVGALPLHKLPAAVDLPEIVEGAELGSVSETILAPLDGAAADKVSLALLGGEHAAAKGGRFILQRHGTDEAGTWKVGLTDARDANVTHPIGQLRLRDGHVYFQWEPAAANQVFATHLRNCVVRFTLDATSHDLRLRLPLQVTPLKVDLTRPEVSERWQLDAPPDGKSTRLAITRFEAPFPAVYTLNPATPIVADSETVVALFGEDPLEQVLLLELAPQLKTVFRLECRAFFQVSPKLDRIPLTSKRLETATSIVASRQVQHNHVAQQLRAALPQIPATDPWHNQVAQSLKQAEAELAETSQATGRLTALADIRQALSAGAAIHFRLYFLADDCEVDLLHGGPAVE